MLFLALSNFEVSFYVFLYFRMEKCHFTNCFGGPFHQTSYLCTAEARRTWTEIPAMDRVLFISVLEPYMLKTYLGKTLL